MISELTKEKLKSDKAACYIIDKNYSIQFANDSGTDFCHNASEGKNFLRTLCGKNDPCINCPLKNKIEAEPVYVDEDALCSFAYVNFSSIDGGYILSKWNEAQDSIASIPEINLAKALEGMDGSREIFDSIAEVYYSEGLNKPKIIMDHYNARDYYNLRIEVHGLKGTSYVIGADHLGDFAKKLEFACRDIEADEDEQKIKIAKATIDSELEDLLTEYKLLLTKLGAVYHPGEEVRFESSDSTSEENIDLSSDSEAIEYLTDLKKRLDDYDLDDVEDMIEEYLSNNEQSNISEVLKKTLKLIKEFNYSEASAYLESYLK